MAVQTISAQVRELEKSIGRQLLKPAGRGVTMTEAGEAAFNRAEQIFQIGEALLDEMRDAGIQPNVITYTVHRSGNTCGYRAHFRWTGRFVLYVNSLVTWNHPFLVQLIRESL